VEEKVFNHVFRNQRADKMKKLVVISGKGGTGKTTICAALANLAFQSTRIIMADCDVDASNLPVLLNPTVEKQQDYIGSAIAVKTKQCSHCGKCADVCRFDAIDSCGNVDPIKCEGCGSCVYVCPENALKIEKHKTGTVFSSQTRFGPLIHADLERGEEASGKLVIKIKELINERADNFEFALIDGSPGTGCPVIASLRGSDAALVVTEPTVSGFHDLKRVLEVCESLSVQPFVCINKANINEDMCLQIEDYCRKHDYNVVGRLPYDEKVLEALKGRQTIIENKNKVLTEKLNQIWSNLKREIK
jgi:MinD superfamily P-loop ATPase